jgi:hypothetical protein
MATSSFWTKIGHFFHNAGVFVSELFVKIFGEDAAHNLAAAAEGILKTELGKIAWTAVQEAEALAAGTDKKAAAFAAILSATKAAGIEAKDSIINMLIELCVQKIKGSFGPAN